MVLRDCWFVLRRRRLLIAGTTVLLAALGLGYARHRPPVYEATAAVVVHSTPTAGAPPVADVETQVKLVESPAVLEEVARRLSRPAPAAPAVQRDALEVLGRRLRVVRVPGTSVLEVTATAADPGEARDLANAVAEAYRDHANRARAAGLREARAAIERWLREVEEQRAGRGAPAGLEAAALLGALSVRHLDARLAESAGGDAVTLMRGAVEPVAPSGGSAWPAAVLGGLLGLGLGMVLAHVREAADASVGAAADAAADLALPVLGTIPDLDAGPSGSVSGAPARGPAADERSARRWRALLVTHLAPGAPLAEACRELHRNVTFARAGWGGKVLLFASPTPGEGTTTTVANLALTMAQHGQRTLLVAADLRRPSLHACFGVRADPGLTDVLLGQARWRDCVRALPDVLIDDFAPGAFLGAPGVDNLDLLTGGAVPPDPGPVLAQPAMARLLREVRDEYDIVLVEAPPALPFTDAAAIAAHADGVVLVHRVGSRTRQALRRTVSRLVAGRAQVWGVVFTRVPGGGGVAEPPGGAPRAALGGSGRTGEAGAPPRRAIRSRSLRRPIAAAGVALAVGVAAASVLVGRGIAPVEPRGAAPGREPRSPAASPPSPEPPPGSVAVSPSVAPVAPAAAPVVPSPAAGAGRPAEVPTEDHAGDGPGGPSAAQSSTGGASARYAVLVAGPEGERQVGGPYGLREAVDLAERLRARQLRVRIARLH